MPIRSPLNISVQSGESRFRPSLVRGRSAGFNFCTLGGVDNDVVYPRSPVPLVSVLSCHRISNLRSIGGVIGNLHHADPGPATLAGGASSGVLRGRPRSSFVRRTNRQPKTDDANVRANCILSGCGRPCAAGHDGCCASLKETTTSSSAPTGTARRSGAQIQAPAAEITGR